MSSVSPASQHPPLAENSGQHLHHTVPVLFPQQASSRRPPRTWPDLNSAVKPLSPSQGGMPVALHSDQLQGGHQEESHLGQEGDQDTQDSQEQKARADNLCKQRFITIHYQYLYLLFYF